METPRNALICGGRTVPDAAASGRFDLVVFLDWDAWAAFTDAHPETPARFIELDPLRREIEADAWAWARAVAGVAAAAAGHQGQSAAHVEAVTRRLVQHGVGFAAARARRCADAIAKAVGGDARIETSGVDVFTAAFLAAQLPSVPKPRTERAPLLPGVRAPFVRSLVGTLRHARRAASRARARTAARGVAAAAAEAPIGFVVQAPRDEAIAGPAVKLLRERGRGVIKLELSNDGRTLKSGFECDLVVDGRDWVDPYPPGILARFALCRRRAVRDIVAALPDELAPVATAFAAEVAAHAGVTAPSLLRRVTRILDDVACERLVLLGETNRIVTPLTCVAEARGIPVTCVQHGIIHDIPQWAEMPFSTFAVFGPAYAEVLTSLGTPPGRIAVTGDPRLDHAVAAEPVPRERVLASLGLEPDESRHLVMFAANYASHRLSGSSMERAFDALVEALDRLPEALLVVKLHPQGAGREAPYHRVLARHSTLPHVIAPRDSRLVDLIAISDVVAVHVSSVGFEAAAMGRPLVVINPDDGVQEVPFVREGIGQEARDAEGVRSLLMRAISGRFEMPDADALAAFNERYNGPLDGHAAERLADAIIASSWSR